MFSEDLLLRASRVLEACAGAGLRLAVAESCTGGLVAGCLTALPNASHVLDRGFVTYSNEAKVELLGVPVELIRAHGAVSEPVARAMAEGALARAPVDLALAVTGIAGPGGATPGKPVGLVHIAAVRRHGPTLHERHVLAGDRAAVRERSVAIALEMIERLTGAAGPAAPSGG
ncbi:MAG: CinA family protein [Proteobacteria bacterium]|nr:CinA family protein [Pseudomonadota bacterium]